jgi:transposase-like protein
MRADTWTVSNLLCPRCDSHTQAKAGADVDRYRCVTCDWSGEYDPTVDGYQFRDSDD